MLMDHLIKFCLYTCPDRKDDPVFVAADALRNASKHKINVFDGIMYRKRVHCFNGKDLVDALAEGEAPQVEALKVLQTVIAG